MEEKYMQIIQNKNEINNNNELKGNDKRIQSCKNVGGEKKRKGHGIEKDFLKQYNVNEVDNPTEYGATSDTTISKNHPIYDILVKELNVKDNNVSNKSGNNIQFVLGNIPELDNIDVSILTYDYVKNIMNIYLKKINSAKPSNILVYKDELSKRWIFFNMDDIVEYISNNCIWRKLDTGRIKGDFKDNSKKGYSQYVTYEYRNTHKSYFLGLNGGQGRKFIELLMDKDYGIKYYCDNINY